jgi:hypothetical protein
MTHPLVWLLWRDTRNVAWSLLERVAKPRGARARRARAVLRRGRLHAGGTPGFARNVNTYGAPSVMGL